MSRPKEEILKKYSENPHCHWCGVKMNFYPPTHKDGRRRVIQPDDMVTVDHVFPLGTKKRNEYKSKGVPSPYVLACHSCNQERGNMEFKEFKKIKHRRIELKCAYCKRDAEYNLIFQRSSVGVCKNCLAMYIKKWNPTDAVIVPKNMYPQGSNWFPIPSILLGDVFYAFGKTLEDFKKWIHDTNASIPDMNEE